MVTIPISLQQRRPEIPLTQAQLQQARQQQITPPPSVPAKPTPLSQEQIREQQAYEQALKRYEAQKEAYSKAGARYGEYLQVQKFISRGKEAQIRFGGSAYQRKLLRDYYRDYGKWLQTGTGMKAELQRLESLQAPTPPEVPPKRIIPGVAGEGLTKREYLERVKQIEEKRPFVGYATTGERVYGVPPKAEIVKLIAKPPRPTTLTERRIEVWAGIPGLKQLTRFEQQKREKVEIQIQQALTKLEERGAITSYDTQGKPIYEGKDLTKTQKGLLMQEGYIKDTRGSRLPYGLQPYRRDDPRFQITKFLVEKPTQFITGRKPPEWLMEYIDLYFKLSIFAPYYEKGMEKKTKAEIEPKQEQVVRYVRKFSDMSDDEYSAFINNLRIKASRGDLREVYAKALRTRDKTLIRDAEKILKDVLGKENAKILFRDVTQQEMIAMEGLGATRFTGLQPKGKISPFGDLGGFDLGELGRIPTMQRSPEVAVTSSVLDLFKKPKLKEERELIKPIIKPEVKERVRIIPTSASSLLTGLDLAQPTKVRERLVKVTASSLLTGQVLAQPQVQVPRLVQPQVFKQPQITVTGFPTPRVPVKPSAPPPPKIPKFGFFWFPGEKKETIGKGYYPEAYIEATKGIKARWKRLSKKPMTKQSAMSMSAKFVDEQISARGRIKPSKKKKEKIIDTGEDYFKINRYKFRQWKQVKGRRTRLPKHNFIERQPFRADKRGEQIALISGRKRRTPFGF